MASPRLAGIWLGFLLIRAAAADEAEPNYIYPVAGQQGSTVSVSVSGKFDPWPPQVWVDAAGITFKPAKDSGKYDVEIAKDAAPGPHLVRLFNEKVASAPRFFIVSSEPELLEVEPNNDFKAAQIISSLPATISGRLDKRGDVDCYAVTLKRGQTLTAWVEAYVLASTFDGMLSIVDANGIQLAFNNDGRTLDPFLTWEAPNDGTFVVQLKGFAYPPTANVHLIGGEGCVYRLHFTNHRSPRAVLPPHEAGERRERPEQEPNDSIADAQPAVLPCTITGCIQKAGDEDRFEFTAVKKRTYEFRLTALSAGSLLEAWLKIEDKDGKELARNEDKEGLRDPQLTWTAPVDGNVTVAVGDLAHHGGEDYIYRLALAEAAPSVVATAVSHFIVVPAGKSVEMKLNVKRMNGFQPTLKLVGKNLPDGVSAPEVEVPKKAGEVTLRFTANADAKPTSQPFQVVLRETGSGKEYSVRYLMAITSEDNGVAQGYSELVINATDQLWLLVSTEPPKSEPSK